MTEQQTIENPTITVYFGRKLGDTNYGNTEAGIHVQVPVEGLATDDKYFDHVVEAARDGLNAATATVLDHLSLPYERNPETFVIEEVLREKLGAVKVDEDGPPPKRKSGPVGKAQKRSDDKPTNDTWDRLVHELETTKPGDYLPSFFDNRGSKPSETSPDFRTKNTAAAKAATGVNGATALWLSSAPEGVKEKIDAIPI